MSREVVWFFGRGLSIGCGLTWNVPSGWQTLDRDKQIENTRETLLAEMNAPSVCPEGIRQFLEFLARHTAGDWRHLTTNWDFLLQREILGRITDNVRPAWLSDSHVFHLNGTIEHPKDHHFRSSFLLTQDRGEQRTNSIEANIAFNHMIVRNTFVMLGMSFECATDMFLLRQLNKVHDTMPVGDSQWLIVNPDSAVLQVTCGRIQTALPYANVVPVCRTLDQWRKEGFRELTALGVFG